MGETQQTTCERHGDHSAGRAGNASGCAPGLRPSIGDPLVGQQDGLARIGPDGLDLAPAIDAWLAPLPVAGPQALAAFSRSIAAASSVSSAAATSSSTWRAVVALAMGAVTPGRAISQARAT